MEHSVYYSSLQRARHAMADESIAATMEVLSVPAVAQALGERAVQVSRVLEFATVPNIHHGRVLVGDVADDRISVIPVYGDDRLYMRSRDLRLNAYQRQALRAGFDAESAEALIGRYAYDRRVLPIVDIPVGLSPGLAASVLTFGSAIELEDDSYISLRSAPMMILSGERADWRSPEVVAHEAYHIHQHHEYPIALPREHSQRIHESNEFEAYALEADIIATCRRIGGYGLRSALDPKYEATLAEEVDAIRLRVQGRSQQPFKASRRIRRLLKQKDITL